MLSASSPVPLLQELLVVTLQLVVEDDAPDVSAAGTEALLGALVRAVDLGVVSQLARLPEAGVERLPGLVVALQAIRLEHVSTTTGQDDDVTVAALEWNSFEKARLLEMSKALPCWHKVPVTVEHVPQVIRVDDPKRSDRGERLALLAVQLIRSLPVSHELAVWATRQVDMATEGTPAVIVAGSVRSLPPRDPRWRSNESPRLRPSSSRGSYRSNMAPRNPAESWRIDP